jgi:hypothetical protein
METNLNYLFIDLLPNFGHLIPVNEPATKEEFLNKIKTTYSLSNAKNRLFYQATQQSKFENIVNIDGSAIFNHNINQ